MKNWFLVWVPALVLAGCVNDGLSGFKAPKEQSSGAPVANTFTFNGYTDHWQNVYENRYRYGNLYRINVPDIDKTIAQSRKDLAADMGFPGLRMSEGFFASLAASDPEVLMNPAEADIAGAFKSSSSVLAYVEKGSEVAGKLAKGNPFPAADDALDAYIMKRGKKVLHVVVGEGKSLETFRKTIADALEVARKYDMKRGWFGAETLLQSVTCTPCDPIDVMGLGMNEGNSWFVFSGYCDFLMGDKLSGWVKEVGDPVVTDLGYAPIFGCENWDNLQVQLMKTPEDWVNFQKKEGGYLFQDVPSGGLGTGPECDGYFANEGNARQINSWGKPFVITTGPAISGLTRCMILFVEKGVKFDRARMWEAIMSSSAVAVDTHGVIMGPELFRKTAQLMALDKTYLEEYFRDRINIESTIDGHRLHVRITNLYPKIVSGSLSLILPEQVGVQGKSKRNLTIPAGASRVLDFELLPSADAMGRLNAVLSRFSWDDESKSVMSSFNLPPAVSTHQLLYGPETGCEFPVSIHNFTTNTTVPVKVSVFKNDAPENAVYSEECELEIAKGSYMTRKFNLVLPAGGYTVKTQAMGVTAETQLGIGTETGEVTLEEKDLDGDGVNEYILENNKVRATLLTTGARVIEYYLKEKDDNLLFKLWPDKPTDDARSNRLWYYYPYGGFEDFLGQASVETHKVYSAEVLKAGGDYAEVRMRADYNGTVIEKTFTLYGGSPLLGIRFALDIKHPEMNVLGPQPILEVGQKHGLEDRILIPEPQGVTAYVMDPVDYYGKIFFPVEGWNADYDTKENISFVGAFPVKRPYYLHMWMNLPHNRDANYTYVELQPWLPLYINNTSYFSYYMWTEGASWTNGVQALRERNLITKK